MITEVKLKPAAPDETLRVSDGGKLRWAVVLQPYGSKAQVVIGLFADRTYAQSHIDARENPAWLTIREVQDDE